MTPDRGGERRAVDWTRLRQRLDAVAVSLAGGTEQSPEHERQVLETRAHQLARAAEAGAAERHLRVLTFSLGTDTYAVEASHVTGVFRLLDLAPLPGAEHRVAGVTAWRGALLTVLDLRRLLGLAGQGLDDRAWVVVIEHESRRRGLLAGALSDVLEVPAERLRVPDDGLAADRRFVRGITDNAVLVLDADKLMTEAT